MTELAADNIERIPTDGMRAEEIRTAMQKPLTEICEIVNRAKSFGLVVSFNISPDAYGRTRVADLSIVKPL